MKTYFISDTHFNHTNIIKYCDRPFDSVEEMNEFIIKQWNNTVKKTDTVWFLGDLVLGTKEVCKDFISRLQGQIYMIKGNHDHFPESFYKECGIKFVSKYPVVLKKKFILSHAPIDLNENSEFINIHGHIHNKGHHNEDKPEIMDTNHICVCVERINYKPIELDIFNHTN